MQKKREMQEDLREFIKITKEQSISSNITADVEKAEEAFSRVNTGISSKFVSNDDVQLAELDKLSRDSRVSERLQSLKANQK